jgi:ribonuclease E
MAATESVVHSTPEASPVSEPVATNQTVVHHVEVPVVQPETTQVQAPAAASVMQATPKPAQQPSSADIDTLLREAGLMMAVTDPEKLRAVQVASDNVTPKTRVPRERKPAAPVSNEPLVQVETQR